jgi:hypothetical protein
MALWILLIIIFIAGGVGGVINALLSDNGFILPRPELFGDTQIYRPGILGNVLTSGVAACISWGLYGPFSSAYMFGGPSNTGQAAPEYGITLAAIVGAVLVGVAGAKWLTNEVDKSLLKAAASTAAAADPSPEKAKQMITATPAQVLKIANSK